MLFLSSYIFLLSGSVLSFRNIRYYSRTKDGHHESQKPTTFSSLGYTPHICGNNSCTPHRNTETIPLGKRANFSGYTVASPHSFYTNFASKFSSLYFRFSWVNHKHVEIARIATNCKPIAFSAKSYGVNSSEFVTSSDLLYHLPCLRIKYSHLNPLLRSGGQLLSVLCERNCTEDYIT